MRIGGIRTVEASAAGLELRVAGALATLHHGGEAMILQDDLTSLAGVVEVPAKEQTFNERLVTMSLPGVGSEPDGSKSMQWLALRSGGYLVPPTGTPVAPPALGPIVRLLAEHERGGKGTVGVDTLLPGGWRLTGGTTSLHDRARDLVKSSEEWALLADRDFANSAPYMGTKRTLLPFIMTAIEGLDPPPTAFIDLMCGSGVVAGAASRRWRTIAADSQEFCRMLAIVQGGGFTRARASTVLRRMREPMAANLSMLRSKVGDLLLEEEALLSAAADWSVLAPRYAEFVSQTPSYPDGGSSHGWDPVAEVEYRRQSAGDRVMPFCLMTAYFANIYFGLRQAVELDCLRLGIDELGDPVERQWALGALVAAASAIATTYGGHFAQPPAPPERLVRPGVARRVLARRHISATREFEMRLLSLSAESESIANSVETVPGSWASALKVAAAAVAPADTLVYLDAPYRREEYSRYYHVLETLVSYGYPTAETKARLPRKGAERFSSEFFTRSRTAMSEALAESIRTILTNGFRCAWSYADRADADALEVLERVGDSVKSMRSVGADHEFKRQGKSRSPGRVKEYLFILEPH